MAYNKCNKTVQNREIIRVILLLEIKEGARTRTPSKMMNEPFLFLNKDPVQHCITRSDVDLIETICQAG